MRVLSYVLLYAYACAYADNFLMGGAKKGKRVHGIDLGTRQKYRDSRSLQHIRILKYNWLYKVEIFTTIIIFKHLLKMISFHFVQVILCYRIPQVTKAPPPINSKYLFPEHWSGCSARQLNGHQSRFPSLPASGFSSSAFNPALGVARPPGAPMDAVWPPQNERLRVPAQSQGQSAPPIRMYWLMAVGHSMSPSALRK